MVTNITKGIKPTLLLYDILFNILFSFVPLFVNHNCICKFNLDCVAMFLKRKFQFNYHGHIPFRNILPRVDKCRSQATKSTTICVIKNATLGS